jgi:hypothetical protein
MPQARMNWLAFQRHLDLLLVDRILVDRVHIPAA